MKPRYYIQTFGCQMNVHDSERMAGMLEDLGYEPTTEVAGADVLLMNTCAVRERPEHKLYSELGELRKLTRQAKHGDWRGRLHGATGGRRHSAPRP
jgi:tRNA-2-methylthio-N6-dimethylallyladenosine synthase